MHRHRNTTDSLHTHQSMYIHQHNTIHVHTYYIKSYTHTYQHKGLSILYTPIYVHIHTHLCAYTNTPDPRIHLYRCSFSLRTLAKKNDINTNLYMHTPTHLTPWFIYAVVWQFICVRLVHMYRHTICTHMCTSCTHLQMDFVHDTWRSIHVYTYEFICVRLVHISRSM